LHLTVRFSIRQADISRHVSAAVAPRLRPAPNKPLAPRRSSLQNGVNNNWGGPAFP
jgi:hypothetical protein